MDVALSKNGTRALRVFFALVVAFLYAPIVILLIFSFNSSAVPAFPLSGFTLHWYHDFIVNADLRAALETSAFIAVLTSVGAVLLGVLDRKEEGLFEIRRARDLDPASQEIEGKRVSFQFFAGVKVPLGNPGGRERRGGVGWHHFAVDEVKQVLQPRG